MSISKVGIVGAGQMGIGIAFVSALAKKQVMILDSKTSQTDKGLVFIDKLLQKQVSKGLMTEANMKEVKGLISTTSDLKDFSGRDFIVEVSIYWIDH